MNTSETIWEWSCQSCGWVKYGKDDQRCYSCDEKMLEVGTLSKREKIRRENGDGQSELSYYK